MFDIVPDRGKRILMQGLPGCISSLTDFWVTAAGLMVTETTISNFAGYDAAGFAVLTQAGAGPSGPSAENRD